MAETERISLRLLLSNPVYLLAFGLGTGLSPWAPGTCGTILAVLAMPLLSELSAWAYGLFLALVCVGGVFICDSTSRKLAVHDHPGIVWDEFAGYWLALWLAPASLGWWLYGFVLFRAFDILKPWPIGWADRRVRGGVGIMLDDLIAGLMTLACVQLTLHLLS